MRAMEDLTREARQARHGGTEKGAAWEGCQGSSVLREMVRRVISAAAA